MKTVFAAAARGLERGGVADDFPGGVVMPPLPLPEGALHLRMDAADVPIRMLPG